MAEFVEFREVSKFYIMGDTKIAANDKVSFSIRMLLSWFICCGYLLF